jgi:hypothetical protein
MNYKSKLFSSVLLCVLIAGITSCSHKIIYDKVMFGKGGGFTGKYDDYFLDKDGGLYSKDPATHSFVLVRDIPRKEAKSIFKEIEDNKLFELGFNNPYNISCYMEIVKGSITNRIVWGDAKNPPASAVTAVFEKLMTLATAGTTKKPYNQKNNNGK